MIFRFVRWPMLVAVLLIAFELLFIGRPVYALTPTTYATTSTWSTTNTQFSTSDAGGTPLCDFSITEILILVAFIAAVLGAVAIAWSRKRTTFEI